MDHSRTQGCRCSLLIQHISAHLLSPCSSKCSSSGTKGLHCNNLYHRAIAMGCLAHHYGVFSHFFFIIMTRKRAWYVICALVYLTSKPLYTHRLFSDLCLSCRQCPHYWIIYSCVSPRGTSALCGRMFIYLFVFLLFILPFLRIVFCNNLATLFAERAFCHDCNERANVVWP